MIDVSPSSWGQSGNIASALLPRHPAALAQTCQTRGKNGQTATSPPAI
jgi:hypothetical protein